MYVQFRDDKFKNVNETYTFLGKQLQNLAQIEVENLKKKLKAIGGKNGIMKKITKCLKRKFNQ